MEEQEQNSNPWNSMTTIRPLLNTVVLFLGAAVVDVLMVPYVLLEYGSYAVRWGMPIMLSLVQAVILFLIMRSRTCFPQNIKVFILYALTAMAIASPGILMLHTCSMLTCGFDFMDKLFSRVHLTKIEKHTRLPNANFYDIDTLVLNPAIRITHHGHESVSIGKYSSKSYLYSVNMYLVDERYDIWVIRRHRKELSKIPNEKAQLMAWLSYDAEKNRTIGGKYQNVSKDSKFLGPLEKRNFYPRLADMYERKYGRSKHTLQKISHPIILYKGHTVEGDLMLYAMLVWGYGFLYMFVVFNRKEEELIVDVDGRIRHAVKQFFDDKKTIVK